jgi:hypothetical protein
MLYYWDKTVGRFRDAAGRFVAKSTIDSYVLQSFNASNNIADTLASFVSNGLVNVGDWKSSFRQEIKDEYIRQYVTARGGVEQMTQADWGSIGGMLKDQYGYLDNFARDIQSGNLSEAQIAARSDMYINSAHEAAERARDRVAKGLDFDMVEWVLNTALENCDDCIAFSEMGIVEIASDPYDGALPGSGATVCMSNCGCHLLYSNSVTGDEYEG